MLAITVETITIDADTPTIKSYSLEIDDGAGGEIVPINGGFSDSLSTAFSYNNVVKGRVYRVRYRIRNDIGWSVYSPMGYLRAADVPSAPPAVIAVTTSATEIALALQPSADSGGSEITAYELWIDDGDLGETFTKLDSYDGLSQSFTIELAVETSLV